jgi:hypothetical protein
MANVPVTTQDQIYICNSALRECGQTRFISDILAPQTAAQLCNLEYIPALQEILAEYPWRFATKKAPLALLYDNTQPPTQAMLNADPTGTGNLNPWLYQYAYPQDCVSQRRIPNGYQHDYLENMVAYEIGDGVDPKGNPAKIIYTNLPNAWAQYVYLMLDPVRYPPLFRRAFVSCLAWKIAPGLTVKPQLVDRLFRDYILKRDKAMARDYAESQRNRPRTSAAEMSRGGWGLLPPWGSNAPGELGQAGAPYLVLG